MRARFALVVVLGAVVGIGVCFFLFSAVLAENREKAAQEARLDSMRPDDCTGDKFSCLEPYYRLMVRVRGISDAVADLTYRFENDPAISEQCHALAHVIGQEASMLFPAVSEAFAHGDPLCWSGYYHGVMEGIVLEMGESEALRTMDSMCAGIPYQTQLREYFYCVHGLGHGVMSVLGDELLDAIAACDSRFPGEWEQQACAGGVFMQNVVAESSGHITDYLDAERPLYPCTDVPDEYKRECFLNHSYYLLRLVNWDYGEAFALCTEAPKEWRQICYESFGKEAAGGGRDYLELAVSRCMEGAAREQRRSCVEGVIDFYMWYADEQLARDFCAAVGDEQEQACVARIQVYVEAR